MKHIKIFSIITFIIMLIALLGTTATVRAAPSQTIWSVTHTFSTATWPLLTCWADPNIVSNTCYNYDNGLGTNYGGLQVKTGFTTLGREFTITPMAVVGVIGCRARVYVRPSQFGYSHYPINGALEIIDVNTWTYLSYKPFSITGPGGFAAVTTSSWVPPNQNVFARIVVTGDGTANTLEIDTLTINCSY